MKPVVFFDLDGVLAGFVQGVLRHFDAPLPVDGVRWQLEKQLGFEGREGEFWAPLGFDFWANLPTLDDGFELLAAVESVVGGERVGLLTSACDTAGCVEGKQAWVRRHLPDYRRRLFTGSAKQLFAGPTKLLIDDHDANVDGFQAAGGVAVQPPRPWNRHRGACLPGGAFPVGEIVQDVLAGLQWIDKYVAGLRRAT